MNNYQEDMARHPSVLGEGSGPAQDACVLDADPSNDSCGVGRPGAPGENPSAGEAAICGIPPRGGTPGVERVKAFCPFCGGAVKGAKPEATRPVTDAEFEARVLALRGAGGVVF